MLNHILRRPIALPVIHLVGYLGGYLYAGFLAIRLAVGIKCPSYSFTNGHQDFPAYDHVLRA